MTTPKLVLLATACLLSPVFVTAWIASVYPHKLIHHQKTGARASIRDENKQTDDGPYYDGEVVGSTGKIGSYILHSLNSKVSLIQNLLYDQYQYRRAFATPRGVSPGCMSKIDTPIYACIPSSSIKDVWFATEPHRREDLVFLCNCVPSRHLSFLANDNATVAVLHFGVSRENSVPKASCAPTSPPTVIYGKHADTLAKLLENDDIPVVIAKSPHELQAAAVKKLVWSSLMWLLCHDVGSDEMPLTVKDVHAKCSNKLQKLIAELISMLEVLCNEEWNTSFHGDSFISLGSTKEIMAYLEMYSMSIEGGNIIPSRDLALKEIHERNGLIISLMNEDQTSHSYHLELIQRVAGVNIATALMKSKQRSDPLRILDGEVYESKRVKCFASNLSFMIRGQTSYLSDERKSDTSATSVVVIGAGMFGSSLAYHLSLRGLNVTVMDIKSNILPKDPSDDIDPGVATSSSFAWLNANDKAPLSYMQLNLLGMETWRRHNLLRQCPNWSGALIRKAKGSITDTESPHYVCIGPLSSEEMVALEPGIKWNCQQIEQNNDEEELHFYPQEGHVNPVEAVKILRLAAKSNGVSFKECVHVDRLVRDNNGRVIGIKYFDSGIEEDKLFEAEMVVVAAGSNTSMPLLTDVHVPLKYEPGVLACTKSSKKATDDSNVLKRIFVDTISQSHILRRSDGTLVVGGGQLIVGGETKNGSTNNSEFQLHKKGGENDDVGNTMLENAVKSIQPLELLSMKHNEKIVRMTQANRPMPLDGLPVIGFVDSSPGLYVAVTHSGITLGPLLGDLAAGEISTALLNHKIDGKGPMQFEILDNYRPSRFEK